MSANFELWINNTLVDTKDDFPLSLNSSISDISQPETRQTTYSKTISIPASKSNRELFDYIFELSHWIDSSGNTNYSPDFDPNLKASAYAYADNTEVFKGIVQLLQISVRENNDIEFEIVLTGKLTDFFKNIVDLELSDLDFSDLDHDYTTSNIEASWSNTSGYTYPLIDYGYNLTLDDFKLNSLFPAIFVKDYWDRIWEGAGCVYQSDFLNDDFFASLIIPFTGANFKMSSDEITDRKFRASRVTSDQQMTVGTTITDTTILFNDDSTAPNFDNSAQYNTANGIFTVGTGLQGHFNFGTYIDLTARYVPSTAAVDMKATQVIIAAISFIKQDALGNNTVLNTYTARIREGVTSYSINTDTETDPTYPNNTYQQGLTGDIYFQSGSVELIETDKVAIIISHYYSPYTVNGALNSNGLGSGFNGIWASTEKFIDASNNIYDGTYYLQVNVGSYIFNEISNANYTEGMTISMNNAVPEKVKQKDFVMSIIKMFNLYLEADPDIDNKFIIEPRDSFYLPATDSDNIIDLSKKLDIEQPYIIKPMGALDFKRYRFKYKDDKDYFNTDYFNRWGETYSEREVEVNNDFLVNEKTIDVIFSATPSVGSSSFDRVIPRILNFDSNGSASPVAANPRILIYSGLKDTNQSWSITDINGQNNYTQYPYAGMLDDPRDPTISLDWEVPDEIYWTNNFGAINYTNKNLYNTNWKKFIDEITDKNSVIVTGWFDITPYDYTRLNFRKIYYFEREYFRLNKIINYNPLNNALTQLEFIKINEGVTTDFEITEADDVFQIDRTPRFLPPELFSGNVSDLGTPKVMSGQNNRVPSSVGAWGIVGKGNLIGEYSDSIFITGDDNSIASYSSGVTIIGGGNTVAGNNITLINTYNKTIDNSNVTYINGVCVNGTDSVIYVNSSKTARAGNNDDAITYLCDATSGNIVLTLPSAVDFGEGNFLNIKKIDASANTITITPDGSETIDDASTKVLNTQYEFTTIQSDGVNWQIIN